MGPEHWETGNEIATFFGLEQQLIMTGGLTALEELFGSWATKKMVECRMERKVTIARNKERFGK